MSEVIKNLELFINGTLPSILLEGVTDICMDIRNKAVQNITDNELVDTGVMRASIIFDVQEIPDGVEGAVGTDNEYSIYVHEGTGLYARSGNGRKEVPWVYRTPDGKFYSTKGIHPTPFLQDAADEVRPNMLNYFRR